MHQRAHGRLQHVVPPASHYATAYHITPQKTASHNITSHYITAHCPMHTHLHHVVHVRERDVGDDLPRPRAAPASHTSHAIGVLPHTHTHKIHTANQSMPTAHTHTHHVTHHRALTQKSTRTWSMLKWKAVITRCACTVRGAQRSNRRRARKYSGAAATHGTREPAAPRASCGSNANQISEEQTNMHLRYQT